MVREILLEGHFGKKGLSDFVERYRKEPKSVVLFGAGYMGDKAFSALRREGIPVEGICDNHAQTLPPELADARLLPLAALREGANDAYIIITPDLPHVHRPIYAQLIDMGCQSKNVFIASMHDQQYFDRGFLQPRQNEVFIDAGSYTGDTIEAFYRFCGGAYAEIYGFEPNPDVQKGLKETLARLSLHDTKIFNRGAWSNETVLHFTALDTMGGHIGEDGNTQIQTKTIDSIASQYPITLIKMDIEGAELEALRGAEKTIRRDRPRLAICVYHKPEDIFNIPEYILSLHPNYTLYLRHYSYIPWETVLYAL